MEEKRRAEEKAAGVATFYAGLVSSNEKQKLKLNQLSLE